MSLLPGYLLKKDYPQKEQVFSFTHSMFDFLFPVIEKAADFENHQLKAISKISEQLNEMLSSDSIRDAININSVIDDFLKSLPAIKEMLLKDAHFILEFDPAADSIEEIILSYPGFYVIVMHRLAHKLYQNKVPVIPRMISELSHNKTGIDINPGAKIGCPFFIDHGTGIVIGETSVIGNAVKIYQGVTLGAIVVKKEEATIKRHPTIEDNVVLYSGSTILGGNTIIGKDSIIGGNTWITESVQSNSVVFHKNQTSIVDRNNKNEPINFII